MVYGLNHTCIEAFEAIFTLNEYQSLLIDKWYCRQCSSEIHTSTHPNYARWVNYSSFFAWKFKIQIKNVKRWKSTHKSDGICENCNVHTRWMVIIVGCRCCCRRCRRRCRCRLTFLTSSQAAKRLFLQQQQPHYTHISRGVWQFRLYTHFSLSSNATYTIYIKKKKNERKMAARRQ